MTARATQRNLSDEGIAQAEALGREIERLEIPLRRLRESDSPRPTLLPRNHHLAF